VVATASFSPELFTFLRELRGHNDRDWFKANKARYEEVVLEPALQFVSDFAPRLEKLSRHMVADPRLVGGSVFRIYRDVRFSRDKSPYKTHAAIHFRHEAARSAHSPVYYLHLEPGNVFAASGVWHPDAGSLAAIRAGIAADPRGWRRITRGKVFAERFELRGDSLKRAPAGYDAEHPLVEDLKRKDFVAVAVLDERAAISPGFLDEFTATARASTPFLRFLCRALELPF
jgi:uncharacterized protein (TIGR02453 family)